MKAKDLTDGQEPMSHAEIDYLQELARELPENPVIINIGAADGVSTLAFLEERPDVFIFSVDILPCEQEFRNIEYAGQDRRRVVRLLGDSSKMEFPNKQCDLLFIDGNHWGAAADIENWVKTGRVKSGGIVAFHDYMEICPPNNPGCVYDDVNKGMVGYKKLGAVDRIIAFEV